MAKVLFYIVFFLFVVCTKSYSQLSSNDFVGKALCKMDNYFIKLIGKKNFKKYVRINKDLSGVMYANKKWKSLNKYPFDSCTLKFVSPVYNFIENNDTIYTSIDYPIDNNLRCYVFDNENIENKKALEESIALYEIYFNKKFKINHRQVKEILVNNGYQNDTLKISDIILVSDTTINLTQSKVKSSKLIWFAIIDGYIKRKKYSVDIPTKYSYDWWAYKYVYIDAITGKILKEELLKHDDNKMPMPL